MALKTLISNSGIKRNFIDKLRIHVTGGAGGMGNPRFDGIGGKGGDVYVIAQKDESFANLVKEFPKKRFSAGVGEDSKVRYVFGAPGNDTQIKVPVGVQVLTEHGRLLGDLKFNDSSVLVAQGGVGGCADNQFCGRRGQSQNIILDLKLISDIGFIGFPKSGKTSLIQLLTKCERNYGKTIRPSTYVAEYSDYRQITLLDLPSLVEGAHNNEGIGHKHLKHLERSKLLVFVVDVDGFRFTNKPLRDAFQSIVILNKELELYNEEIVAKPVILVINKMDKKYAKIKHRMFLDKINCIKEALKEMPDELMPRNLIKFDEIIAISTENNEEINELRNKLRRFLDVNANLNILTQNSIKN